MNDIKILRATEQDAEAVLAYLKTVGGETDNLLIDSKGVPFTVEQEADFIGRTNNSPNSVMLVAWAGQRIAGVASFQGNARKRIAHRGEIAISVLKEYWGTGVGSQLMRELIDFAKSIHIEVIHLEVRSDNVRAIGLYERYGFRRFGTYHNFFKIDGIYHDADYMNLYL